MPHKQNLKDILAKLKSWSESSGDEVLDQHLNELENEINASFAPQSDEEGGGGNHPTDPPAVP